jgi:hypothetical protein
MGLSSFIDILSQYRNASSTAPPPNTEEDYSRVAQTAPQAHVASGLTEAFRSGETPPFGEMLRTLFSNSNGQQRAGILNQLLGAVGRGGLQSGALSGLSGFLTGGKTTVTPEEANQVSPETAQQLAEHAQERDPSIVEQASAFYAQHPTLVKSLGAGALALIMSHLSRK